MKTFVIFDIVLLNVLYLCIMYDFVKQWRHSGFYHVHVIDLKQPDETFWNSAVTNNRLRYFTFGVSEIDGAGGLFGLFVNDENNLY